MLLHQIPTYRFFFFPTSFWWQEWEWVIVPPTKFELEPQMFTMPGSAPDLISFRHFEVNSPSSSSSFSSLLLPSSSFACRINLCILFPILTHKLTPDLHSPACQHSCKVETCGSNCILSAGEYHSAVRDEWQHAQRVLSVAFASQCSDLTSSLSPQYGSTAWIQNQPLKKMLFSHLQCVRIWTIALTLSGNPSDTHEVIFLQQWGNYFLKVLLLRHYHCEHAVQFWVSWPNCASWCIQRFLESQKEILFHFTVGSHKSSHCSFW